MIAHRSVGDSAGPVLDAFPNVLGLGERSTGWQGRLNPWSLPFSDLFWALSVEEE